MAVAPVIAAPSTTALPVEDWLNDARPLFDDTDRVRSGSWLASGLSHGLLLLGFVALTLVGAPPSPPERPFEALTVEIVSAANGAGAEGALTAATDAPPLTSPPTDAIVPERFEVALPERAWPDALGEYIEARRSQEAADEALLTLSFGVRQALRTAHYCRLNATGIAADLARCNRPRFWAIVDARVAALDPDIFQEYERREQARERSSEITVRSRSTGRAPTSAGERPAD
jgi:hypothetical protein